MPLNWRNILCDQQLYQIRGILVSLFIPFISSGRIFMFFLSVFMFHFPLFHVPPSLLLPHGTCTEGRRPKGRWLPSTLASSYSDTLALVKTNCAPILTPPRIRCYNHVSHYWIYPTGSCHRGTTHIHRTQQKRSKQSYHRASHPHFLSSRHYCNPSLQGPPCPSRRLFCARLLIQRHGSSLSREELNAKRSK